MSAISLQNSGPLAALLQQKNTCALCLSRRRARVTVDPNGVLQHGDVRIGLPREFFRSDVIAEDHHKYYKFISLH